MRVLGIETSCDETGIAIYCSKHGLLAHAVYTQTDIHRIFGGVVPELASRDHVLKILPMIKAILQEAHLSLQDLAGIAYTAGPGLISAIMVGAALARSLGYALQIPTLGVHHMEAHLLAPMLEEEKPAYPFVALLVSGGHTLLVKVEALGHYQLLGESVDDAVGEAFDKTAKLLGLPYPGGPELAKLAEQGQRGHYQFPRPMIHSPDFNFSFSGLKTSVLQVVTKATLTPAIKADIAKSFEEAVVDTLVSKCRKALLHTALKQLVIGGGVSANKSLRADLAKMASEMGAKLYYPKLEFCTDNGAMIAYTGCQRLLLGQHDDLTIKARPRWSLEELTN
ncbi:MAG: tRNA (adenosine(37)-N6)-threonylcarbamoyltransferase complex transferase subunit TsaD [Gammaproteobacteria bacterium RIFCSPHIGHO2_12_FULL_35_23]|nr:MAG: tRNA (adenosine(37)-N6)-threonylcarbamoyltransferase complex transferase subunit TsaD [Gammaproteobacteria bacterium RIFCSPHIGHO2_12_FULL_35_23]